MDPYNNFLATDKILEYIWRYGEYWKQNFIFEHHTTAWVRKAVRQIGKPSLLSKLYHWVPPFLASQGHKLPLLPHLKHRHCPYYQKVENRLSRVATTKELENSTEKWRNMRDPCKQVDIEADFAWLPSFRLASVICKAVVTEMGVALPQGVNYPLWVFVRRLTVYSTVVLQWALSGHCPHPSRRKFLLWTQWVQYCRFATSM